MCSDPIRDERVIEALEACRPGSDDSALPELGLSDLLAVDPCLRELHERLELADFQFQAAMSDVPVPEGLQSRILARLSAANEPLATTEGRRSRRRWLISAGGLAALAASLFVAFWVGMPGPTPHDEAGILAVVCRQFLQEAEADFAQGRLLAESQPPARFPLSRAVARVPDIRWRAVRGLLGEQVIAYDFPAAGSRQATLYVAAAPSSESLRTRPPMHPIQSTGGLSASVWREDGRLYVLVVRGDIRAYRRLIYAPSGPLT
ncbi:MAG: hypothetical protein RBS80_02520 [Thermoguttaceae bacterium]|jgi:hypothetical protein|nr:hypothetical protein [Thermoguttaceae bacterium]